ncbi:MAG: flippase [Candidatus Omnitrophica bacterium]|nr:flippase [Candidatus Omnitrophota bacterium]
MKGENSSKGSIEGYRRFISDIGMIGITEFAVRASGLVTLPLLTRMLLPSEYGLWALILITVTIVSSLFQGGLGISMVRFVPSEKERESQARVISSILTGVSGMSLGGMVFFWAIAPALGNTFLKIPAEQIPLFRLGAFFIPLYAVREIVVRAFRALRWMGYFAVINFFKTFSEIVGLLLLYHGRGSVADVVRLYLVIEALTVGVGLWTLYRKIPFKHPAYHEARPYLLFGLPLMANALLLLVIHSSDRYLLSYFLGLSAAGVYSAAVNLSMVTLLFLMPIQSVLLIATADLYDSGQMDEVRKYFNYSLKYYLILTFPIVSGLFLYGRPFVEIMTTESYAGERWVLPGLSLGCLFYGVYQLLIFATYLRKQTYWDLGLLLGGSLINIVLNLLFIPFLKTTGAAMATAISFFLLAIVAHELSRRYLKFVFDFAVALKVLVASGAMILVVASVSSRETIWDPFPILLGCLVYGTVLVLLRTFRLPEIRLLTSFFHARPVVRS